MTTTANYGYTKKSGMKGFIKPTEEYAKDMKKSSDKISIKIDEISKDLKAFTDAFQEIKGKHREGMNMKEIKNSYEQSKNNEINIIEDDILDIFSKKLKSLKQSLNTDGEY